MYKRLGAKYKFFRKEIFLLIIGLTRFNKTVATLKLKHEPGGLLTHD